MKRAKTKKEETEALTHSQPRGGESVSLNSLGQNKRERATGRGRGRASV